MPTHLTDRPFFNHACLAGMLGLALCWPGAASAAGYAYQSLFVEGAVSTSATGINEAGAVVGSYQLERGRDLLVRPFSYQDGVYTVYPAKEPATYSFDDVNDSRAVVANVGHRDFTSEAFYVAPGGKRTLLAVPGAISTQAYALSDNGLVAGSYLHDLNELGIARTTAFVWQAQAGYRHFDVPGAAGLTIAWGVNRAGTVVGVYADADLVYHGFVRTRSGQVRTLDYPGSPYTQLMGINERGEIVGFYQDPEDFILRGFVYRDGRFTRVGPVEAVNGSYPYRITNDGRVVGYYLDANYRSYGFVATPTP
jgi:uncharacterized membrane protein